MKKFFTVACILFSVSSSLAQSADEAAVRKVLSNQEAAWNLGNIHDFMKSYWADDSLVFVGKTVTYGWQSTLENYKKRYPDTAAMGKLSFNLLECKPLSTGYYFVVGGWHLQRTVGDVGGYFTLLFKKIKGQWFIIADHSS